jgi:hypothetical protein
MVMVGHPFLETGFKSDWCRLDQDGPSRPLLRRDFKKFLRYRLLSHFLGLQTILRHNFAREERVSSGTRALEGWAKCAPQQISIHDRDQVSN